MTGRLAVQLKLITREQLGDALRAQEQGGGEKRLGAVLVEKGFINERQLAKLQSVQRDLIAKHQAKQAAKNETSPERVASPRVAAEAAPVVEPAASASPRPAVAQPQTPPVSVPAAAPQPQQATPAPVPAAQPQPPQQVLVVAPESEDMSLALVVPEPTDAHRERLMQLLRDAVQSGASDVHIHAGATPKQRLNGFLEEMSATPTPVEEAAQMVAAALTPAQREELSRIGEVDFSLEVAGVGRFRANSYRQHRGFDAVFRTINPEPPTLEELGLPADLSRFTEYHQGMVLITGPAGCGKSATLAALVAHLQQADQPPGTLGFSGRGRFPN